MLDIQLCTKTCACKFNIYVSIVMKGNEISGLATCIMLLFLFFSNYWTYTLSSPRMPVDWHDVMTHDQEMLCNVLVFKQWSWSLQKLRKIDSLTRTFQFAMFDQKISLEFIRHAYEEDMAAVQSPITHSQSGRHAHILSIISLPHIHLGIATWESSCYWWCTLLVWKNHVANSEHAQYRKSGHFHHLNSVNNFKVRIRIVFI